MAGYFGQSMSNNAVKAYGEGKKPITKWNKKGIIARLEEKLGSRKPSDIEFGDELFVEELKGLIDKAPLVVLRKTVLVNTEYHHTGYLFKITKFYDAFGEKMDSDALLYYISLLKKALEEYKPKKKEVKPPPDPTKYKATCKIKIAVLDGRRRKYVSYVMSGVIQGIWFTGDNGKRKNINGKNITILTKEPFEDTEIA